MSSLFRKRLAILAVSLFATLCVADARSEFVYTLSYAVNTSNAQIPGFGGLPSNILIEGQFSYIDGPSALQGNTAVYNLISQEIKINGNPTIVRAGGTTGPTASPLQIGNNDSTLGFLSDNILTFALVDGNNDIGNGLRLGLVSPRFVDLSSQALSAPALPLDGSIYSRFPIAEVLINYSEGGSSYGNVVPLSYFALSIENTAHPIPEPASIAIWCIGGIGMVLLARRRAKKAAAV